MRKLFEEILGLVKDDSALVGIAAKKAITMINPMLENAE